MTGFTLGNDSGATLGGADGATLGVFTAGRGFTLGTRDGATLGNQDGGTLGTIGVSEFVLSAPVQESPVDHPTATVTALAGEQTLAAPVQGSVVDHPTATIERLFILRAPVQETAVDHPTATLAATSTPSLAAPVQTSVVDHPTGQIGFPSWLIDGTPVETYIEEVAGFDRLSLTFRTDTATLTNTFRPLKSDEGKVDVLATDDGGFVAVDRADGGNTFELTPPVFRLPLREIGDYHVERYEETVASAGVNEWTVELEFVPTDNRTDSPAINETANTDEWLFETHTGDIATSHVDADALGTGADGVERFEVVMRLTFEQAHAWEAAFDKQNATRVRTIPDATNVAVDDTASDENTVTVTPSTAGSEVPQGSYVVDSWESVRLNDAFQEMTVELASTQ